MFTYKAMTAALLVFVTPCFLRRRGVACVFTSSLEDSSGLCFRFALTIVNEHLET